MYQSIDIGPWCSNPYDCDFKGHCWQHIPEMSVFSLRGNRVLQFALYNQGIVSLDDVVPERASSGAEAAGRGDPGEEHIYPRRMKSGIFSIHSGIPLYFLDFETFADAVPRFDGIRPYQNVPYQYSLHYLEDDSAPLEHHEYLAQPGIDPRSELTAKLISQIPDNACVLAYVASFEKGVLQDLALWFPEYADKIERIISNLIDLAYSFSETIPLPLAV